MFVHGIWGDGWGTWVNKDTGAYWPRLVASDPAFEDYDVFVHDYETRLVENTVQIPDLVTEMHTRLEELFNAHENVSFVTHSMGGLVTRALLLDHRDWATKTRVIFFFATPTLGSTQANRLTTVVRNVTASGMGRIEANAFLLQQSNSWKLARFNIASYCGFETSNTAVLGIVGRVSAEALCTEPANAIEGDHLAVVKPRDINSLQHVAVRGAVRRLAATTPVTGPPVYETRWSRVDEAGREYKQVFIHRTENRHGRSDIVANGTNTLDTKQGRIYRVDYSCVGFPCGWSYNPDGGYGGKTLIQGDGHSFTWWRKWDGDPCDDIYTAYYEVPAQVCVANCTATQPVRR